MSAWYAISVSPAAERRVKDALTEHKVTAYYPVEKVWRTRPGRRTTHERPFIRGYVFAETDDHPTLVALSHDIEGAQRVFGFRRTAAEIAAFIGDLRQSESAGDFDATIARDKAGKVMREIEVGSDVRVKTGPFSGFAGKLLNVTEKRRAQIVLQMLGGEVEMTVDFLKLEAA